MLLYLVPLIECLCCPGFNYLQQKKWTFVHWSSLSVGELAEACSITLSPAANASPADLLNLCLALIAVALGMYWAMLLSGGGV